MCQGLQHQNVTTWNNLQPVSSTSCWERILQKAGACHSTKSASFQSLTSELGGRFFLNLARITPALPCARVTCTQEIPCYVQGDTPCWVSCPLPSSNKAPSKGHY